MDAEPVSSPSTLPSADLVQPLSPAQQPLPANGEEDVQDIRPPFNSDSLFTMPKSRQVEDTQPPREPFSTQLPTGLRLLEKLQPKAPAAPAPSLPPTQLQPGFSATNLMQASQKPLPRNNSGVSQLTCCIMRFESQNLALHFSKIC